MAAPALVANRALVPPKTNPVMPYINETLAAHIDAGNYKYSALAWCLEKNPDPYRKCYNLTIISTSLSELEGSDDGLLAEYTYHDRNDAYHDIELFEDTTGIHLDEL